MVEFEKSADALQDYGVLVGKVTNSWRCGHITGSEGGEEVCLLLIQVSCNKELVRTYCTDERLLHRAVLFRYAVRRWRSLILWVWSFSNSVVSSCQGWKRVPEFWLGHLVRRQLHCVRSPVVSRNSSDERTNTSLVKNDLKWLCLRWTLSLAEITKTFWPLWWSSFLLQSMDWICFWVLYPDKTIFYYIPFLPLNPSLSPCFKYLANINYLTIKRFISIFCHIYFCFI